MASDRQIRLSSFLSGVSSSPIPVVSAQTVPASEGDKSAPTWSPTGTSPVLSRPSLRDIQMQQMKKQANISHSPKTRSSGFSISSVGSPLVAGGTKDSVPNRWFKPESDAPSFIRSIQIVEKAMNDLERFYSSVKLVKPQQ